MRIIGRALAISVALLLFSLPAQAQPTPVKPADVAKQIAELQARLSKIEAQGETNTLALAQISTRLTELSQQLATLKAGQTTSPELVDRVDETSLKATELERQVEELRTQLADLEQPYAAPAADGPSGMTLGSGDFTATFSGYFQTRWTLELPRQFDTISTSSLRIRRGRIGVSGNAGSIFDYKIRYKALAELIASPSLRDYYADVEFRPELILRVGQDKMPFLRNFSTSSKRLLFPERSVTVDRYRYDRDIGASLHGRFLDGKLGYRAGVSNGAGQNIANDNIDFAVSARVDGVALGKRFGDSYGDIKSTETPSLMLRLSAVHDLVRVPELVAGVPVMERDVDADAILDNVRVLSLAADATFRLRGLELEATGLWRRESWGTILEHSANEDLASLIDANSNGNRNYLGVIGQASYVALPDRLVVGARGAYSEQTYLRLGRQQTSDVAPGERLFELDAVCQLYTNGKRLVGLQYTLTNYNALGVPDPNNDVEHRFILESHLEW